VFLGPDDRHFGVLSLDNNTLQVYLTAGYRSGSHPLFTISLNKPSQLDAGLFPGPACLNVPKVLPPPPKAGKKAKDGMKKDQAAKGKAKVAKGSAEALAKEGQPEEGKQEEEEDDKDKPPPDGCGVVLYQTEDGHLAMAGLPAAQGVVQVRQDCSD
jgi:hypothetical protein